MGSGQGQGQGREKALMEGRLGKGKNPNKALAFGDVDRDRSGSESAVLNSFSGREPKSPEFAPEEPVGRAINRGEKRSKLHPWDVRARRVEV